MKKLIISMVCVMGLVFAVTNTQATLIPLAGTDPGPASSSYVGLVTPSTPANEANEAAYINYLITLAPGAALATGDLGQSYSRVGSTIGSLTPLTLPLVYSLRTTTSNSLLVPFTGDFYFMAKYDAGNAGAWVWLLNAQAGDTVSVPQFFTADSKYGLSGLTAYSNSPVPIPAAAWLLGSGLVGLVGLKRRIGKKA